MACALQKTLNILPNMYMHKQIESFFGAGDGNKDGMLTFEEFVAGRAAMQRASPLLPLGPRPLALWGALPCACQRLLLCSPLYLLAMFL
jgi:hypothetical protein